ncbi:hypothetical protein HORM4_1120165 [Vibrio harveyi]|nr:hypothetical protein HORM4_1120165 [Vibrio harveyi]
MTVVFHLVEASMTRCHFCLINQQSNFIYFRAQNTLTAFCNSKMPTTSLLIYFITNKHC